MTKTVQYFGTPNYSEEPLTGVKRLWTFAQRQDLPDTTADQLVAGANFAYRRGLQLFNAAGALLDEYGAVVGGGSSSNNIPKVGFLTKFKGGQCATQTSTATGATFQVQTCLEAPFVAVRIGILNADTNAIPGVRATVLASAILGADNDVASNNAGATWKDATFGGATSGTLPAGNSIYDPSVTWTDMIPLQSVARGDAGRTLPILSVRVDWPVSVLCTYCAGPGAANGALWESDNAGVAFRPFRTRFVAGRFAANADKAGLVETINSLVAWSPIIIQYYTASGVLGRTITIIGDSIPEGNPATTLAASGLLVMKRGWPGLVQNTVSSQAAPLETINIARTGQKYNYFNLQAALATKIAPKSFVIFEAGTFNDSGAGAISQYWIDYWKGGQAQVKATLDAAGMKYAVTTQLGTYSTRSLGRNLGASDALRVAANAELVAAGAAGTVNVIDLDAVFSSGQSEVDAGISSSPQIYPKANLQADGTHPNEAGEAALAVPVVTFVNAH